MKRFLLKAATIVVCAVLTMGVCAVWAMRNCPEVRYGIEVWDAIRPSFRVHPDARTVLLGDSVGHQLLNPTVIAQSGRRDLVSLTCNQAITPIGNRLLLENYLARNPQTKRVVYVVRPGSLTNDGRRQFTFHYLIYPFADAGLLPKADPRDLAMLRCRFGAPVLRSKTLRKLLYANDFLYGFYETYLVRIPKPDPAHPVPEANLRNLAAMEEICRSHGAEFHLVPPPVLDGKQDSILFCATNLSISGFPEIAKEYAAGLRCRPASDFLDGIHLRPGPQAEESRDMLANHPLLRQQEPTP